MAPTEKTGLQHPRVVIVGGGFGGLRAAQELKNAPVRILVIDRSNHHLFQPLLYQVATAALSPADIAVPIRSVLRKDPEAEVVLGEVRGVDASTREVLLEGRRIPYDYLILATGARHSYFGKEEWARHAPGLKTILDATLIREKILTAFEKAEIEEDPAERDRLLNFVLIGGGPTGVEMAGSIAELAHVYLAKDFRHINPAQARVMLIEAGPRVLAAFPPDLSEKARLSLQKLGVEVRTSQRVEHVDALGVMVAGQRIESRNLIWTAGVVASPAGHWIGAETDRVGRVKVAPDLTVPGHPEIYVIGDTAAVAWKEGRMLPGVASVAMQQGKYVAKHLRARILKRPLPGAFEYWDKGNMATIGKSSAVAETGRLHLWGFVAWMAWLGVHIAYLIGFRNRLLVMMQWAWAYFTFQRGARLITRPLPQQEAMVPFDRAGRPT